MSDWKRASRKNKSYKLLPYDAAWAEEFKKLKLTISPLFGGNLVSFEHIGSTSIPGMLAKPQIDVCAVVKDLGKVRKIRDTFVELGYQARGDYVGQNEEYFTYDEKGERKHNIHTLEEGNPAIEGYLSFREYLRANKEARDKYIAIKEELRDTYGEGDYNSYDWQKGDKIESLKQDAREWYRQASKPAD